MSFSGWFGLQLGFIKFIRAIEILLTGHGEATLKMGTHHGFNPTTTVLSLLSIAYDQAY